MHLEDRNPHRLQAHYWLLLLVAAACAPEPDPSILMEADRQFAADVAQGGSDAWASWFAADGAMVQPNVGEIRGQQSIKAFVGYLDDPNVDLTWEPSRADISRSGDLGWTTGTYTFRSTAGGVQSQGRGVYVSIWRLQDDGRWKVIRTMKGRRGTHALYDLITDPGEQSDRASSEPGQLATLKARLQAYESAPGPLGMGTAQGVPQRLDDRTRQQLEALGYVGDTGTPE